MLIVCEGSGIELQTLPCSALPLRFLFVHKSRARSRFTTDDDPVDAAEWQSRDRAKERLDGEKANFRRNLGKRADAVDVEGAFDTGAEPDIRRPRKAVGVFEGKFGPLRENLELVLRALFHHREDLADELERDIRVKQVGLLPEN